MSNKLGTSKPFPILILAWQYTKAVVRRCFTKYIFLKIFQNSQDKTWRLPSRKFIEKETPAHMFSRFKKKIKNTFFIEELWATTSKYIFLKQFSVLSTEYCSCLGRSKLRHYRK